MNANIGHFSKKRLIKILEELIEVISELRLRKDKYLLQQNYSEAKSWLLFLKEHDDKEELQSLEDEVVERLHYKFDVMVTYFDYWDQDTVFTEDFYEYKKLDNKRRSLMHQFLVLCDEYL